MRNFSHLMARAVCAALRALLCFDRRVVKRFLNIETPLYKFSWSRHVVYIQRLLNEG